MQRSNSDVQLPTPILPVFRREYSLAQKFIFERVKPWGKTQ